MALTPEDVVKKEFTKPKGFGRSGYDEIQVDDFLDEIVVELRRLNAENEDLTGKLEDLRRSKGVAGKEGGSTAADTASGVPALTPVKGDADKADADATAAIPVPAKAGATGTPDAAALAKAREELASAERDLATAKGEREKVQREVAEAKERLAALQKQIEQAEADSTQRTAAAAKRAEEAEAQSEARVRDAGTAQGGSSVAGVQAPGTAATAGNDSAAGVIALAQRLHDEHVREGETTRDRLIKEAQERHDSMVGEGTTTREKLVQQGQSKHDELVGTGQKRHDELMRQANERSTGLVKEAEERKQRIIGQLTTERESISTAIEQLKSFEHEYRSKLKGFIQGQLKDLDGEGVQEKESAPGGQH
ncbi:DivIVA domain-containing protein [Allobranchiibius huperziae]|uniref:Cell wall synthesis protein Wag31 n=1 Tax=Allobranchiibius huperziae TaxID=1874116 RepID=A0A853DJB6_9MICO|nr:DivIVA domain-containing protein [Allobranchiibius huperziae]NYJ75104.1 DivIVA domain-containing protein [Allobranchiibius huperziae]